MYENMNARVFGISVDSVFTLSKYHEEQKYNFPLLSDFNKDVSEAYSSLYNTWIFDMKGVSKRSAFVIDGEGIIQYAEILENPGLQPDFNAINNTLASLQLR
jgi:peroxiredoxin